MSVSNRQFLVGMAVLIAAVSYQRWRKSPRDVGPTGARLAEMKRAMASRQAPIVPLPVTPDAGRPIPWEHTAPMAPDKGFALDIRIQRPSFQCAMGDLDAIRGDLKRTSKKNLLLSLEPILPEDTSFAPVTQPIGPKQLYGIEPLHLRLPAMKGPRQLGLFLCRDSERTGRCAGKRLEPINQILAESAYVAKQPGTPPEPPDRIYFFHYLYLDNDGTLAFFRNAPVAPHTFADLRERFARLHTGAQSELELKLLDRAKDLLDTLRPLPLSATGHAFTMLLPGTDENRCKAYVKFLPPAPPIPAEYLKQK